MTNEYTKRLKIMETFLEKKNIDLGIITDPANVFYYTGFLSDPHERFMALVINVKKNETVLFVPALDEESAKHAAVVKNIIPISDEEDPFKKLQSNVSDTISTIGLEKKAMNVYRYERLQATFANVSYFDIQPFISSERMKKSRFEIEQMRKPIQIIERVLAEGIKKVQAGMSEMDLTAELEYLMRKFGADGPSFSTIVLSGKKASLPHGIPGSRKLENGDFLLIDFGVIKDGYCSDITRTFVIGEATEKQKEIYHIVLKSTNAGIDAVKAGVPLKTFDIAARNVIKENGYGAYFNNRVGHGLGIEVHEEPSIHENNESIAEPGLLFTIEPGIYIPNYGGVRIEDNVYINAEGKAEVLTTYPKDLQIL